MCLFLRLVLLVILDCMQITGGIDKIHIYFKYTFSCKNTQQKIYL